MRSTIKIRKITALLLAVIMLLGQSAAVSAADNDPADENYGWKVEQFGKIGEITVPEGGMEYYEDGFKETHTPFYQAGTSSIVIYNENAPELTNSVWEFDLIFQDDVQKCRIGFFPRFQDPQNCGGIAIDTVASLQASTMQGGSESWPALANDTGFSIEHNREYHFKFLTDETSIKMYVDGKLITQRTQMNNLPASGKYAFRIWGIADAEKGQKYVQVSNMRFAEYKKSQADKTDFEIQSSDWGLSDVEIPLTLAQDDTVTAVKNGVEALAADTDYTLSENKLVISKDYIAKQADTFSLNIEFDGGSQSQVTFTKKVPFEQFEYVMDFTTQQEGVVQKGGSGTIEYTEDGLHIKGGTTLHFENAPLAENGEIELVFEELNDDGGVGFLYRINGDVWQSVYNANSSRYQYDTSLWNYRSNKISSYQILEDGTPIFKRNGYNHTLKLRYVGNTVTMWLDGQHMKDIRIASMDSLKGIIGLSTEGATEIILKKVTYKNIDNLQLSESSEEKTISLGDMSVKLAADFPRVISYELNSKTMYGSQLAKNYVSINGWDYPATAEISEETETSVTYNVKVEEIGVSFDVVYTVLENNVLDMRIKNIADDSFTVYTIGFPEQPLISANSSQSGAKLDASMGASDVHLDLTKNSEDKVLNTVCTIPVITTDELSASMANNVLNNLSEFTYRSFDMEDGTTTTGFWNTEFLYKGLDGARMYEDEDLYCQVVLTEDTNEDGIMDWQDGANALKTIIDDKIVGGETVRNSTIHVGYNFSSVVQHPFLKVADNMKRLSNYMDGFGQILVFKGYANEGHDSGHADYADINQRAGGAEDMQLLTEIIEDIDGVMGIHINHSEAYPEAKMFTDETMTTRNGWQWLDQSKYIRREVDILNGGMDSRLDEMFEKVPGIGFVYVDTYRDDRYAAARLAQNLSDEHGVIMGTEDGVKFDRWTAWVHWPSIGDGMHRFVYHQDKDVYSGSNLFRGGYNRSGGSGFMSWQHTNNINDTVKMFYTSQLPQKYLMHYDVRKMISNEAIFEGNVRSVNNSGTNEIYKDGNLIAKGDLVFIPWYAEDSETKNPDEAAKIYHWNPSSSTTEWTLPAGWENQTTVKLYKTTQNGKVFVEEIEVKDGKVSINAQANTPYVIYKGNEDVAPDVTKWSEGSPIKDTSFNSRDFSIWQASSESGETDHITIEDDSNGVAIVNIRGAEDGSLSQTMTGLVPGQKYRVSVWTGATNGKTSRLTVVNNDGTEYENYTENTVRQSYLLDHYSQGKMMQRIWVDFVATGETAEIILSADKSGDNGLVQFMETRIVKTDASELPEGYVAYEDFEHVDQAHGIFVPESREEHSHLSQTHEGYTTDTISGEWSLKMGTSFRTLPSTVRLLPNTKYTMEFKTIGSGNVSVFSETTNVKVLDYNFEEGENKVEFTTDGSKDTVIRFAGNGVMDGAKLILDDFMVYSIVDKTPPTVPENLKGESVNGSTVNLTWDASTDEDTGISGYNIYRNGELIDSTTETSYTDNNVTEFTVYNYSVSAINLGSTESDKSAEIKVAVGNDNSLPVLTGIKPISNDKFVVTFSKAMDKESAEKTENYIVSDGLKVTSAVLGDDLKSVTLTIEGVTSDTNAVLYTENIADNTISKNICSSASTVTVSLLSRWYKMDETDGDTAYDFTGNENGVKAGKYNYTEGKNGYAMTFNGGEKIQLGDTLFNESDNWTISTWFNVTGETGQSQTILSNNTSGDASSKGMWFYINGGSKKLCVSLSDSNGNGSIYLETPQAVSLNTWNHTALVKDGDTLRLYLNGVLAGEKSIAGLSTKNCPNDVRIGGNFNGSGSFLHGFKGAMDDFRVFASALDESQVVNEYEKVYDVPTISGDKFYYDKSLGGDLQIDVNYNGYTTESVICGEEELLNNAVTVTPNGFVFAENWLNNIDGECTVEVTFIKGEDSQVISFNIEAIASALKPDKSELFFLKAEAEELDNVYTVNSYKALQEKIALAEQIIANPDATESDITDAVNQLTAAMEGLKYNKGDVNGDGKIDIIDTSLIQTYIIRKEVSGDFYLDPADSDGNGTINILDATMTQLVASGNMIINDDGDIVKA